MDDTIRHLTKVLGGTALESMGHSSRFVVDGKDGARLVVRIEHTQQRLLAELIDSAGNRRADLDVAPIRKVHEDSDVAGRVILHAGTLQIRIDTKPALGVYVVSTP